MITQKFRKVGSGDKLELYSELRSNDGTLLGLYRWHTGNPDRWIESVSHPMNQVEIDKSKAIDLLLRFEREKEHRNISRGVAQDKLEGLVRLYKEANSGGTKSK